MGENKHEKFSTQELEERKGKIAKVNSAIFGLMVIYGIYMFYNMANETWNSKSPIIIIPILLIIIVFANRAAIKRINTELSSRSEE